MIKPSDRAINMAFKEVNKFTPYVQVIDVFTKLPQLDRHDIVKGKRKAYEIGREDFRKSENIDRRRTKNYIK